MFKLNNIKYIAGVFLTIFTVSALCSSFLTTNIASAKCQKIVDSDQQYSVKMRDCTPSEQAVYDADQKTNALNEEYQKLLSQYNNLNAKCNGTGVQKNIIDSNVCLESDKVLLKEVTQALVQKNKELTAAKDVSKSAQDVLDKERLALDDGGSDEIKSDCMPQGIGWLLCPVMNFTASIVDIAYDAVQAMLTTPALNTSTDASKNPMYSIWSSIRSIANIIFVIAFIIIIFSQLTNIGISNYGIKKLLPKIIIAAILVNLSYFICAIAIDISNIIGSNIKGMFDFVIKEQMGDEKIGTLESITKGVLSNSLYIGIATAVPTVTATIVGGWLGALTLLVPGLITAFLAIAAVFIVLTLRQALIILLVVISPIAFVLYLLPNTESWFKKWKDMFVTMLMMFPIIAAVFGASKLAAFIVVHSSENFFIQISGVFMQFIPLAITPLVMKTAGGVLNKVGGFINNPRRGPFDALKNGAADYRSKQMNLRDTNAMNGRGGRFGSVLRWNARRRASLDESKLLSGNATKSYLAKEIQNNEQFRNSIAGGNRRSAASDEAINSAMARAINTNLNIKSAEIKDAEAVISHLNLSSSEKLDLAKGLDITTSDGRTLSGMNNNIRHAAIRSALKTATVPEAESIIESAGTMDSAQRQTLSGELGANGFTKKASHITGPMLGQIQSGTVFSNDSFNTSLVDVINKGKLSAESISGNDVEALNRLATVFNDSRINDDARAKLKLEISNALKPNTKISDSMSAAQKAVLQQIVPIPSQSNNQNRPVILDQYGNPFPPTNRP